MGSLIFLIILMIMFETIVGSGLQENKLFIDHFPVWRGASSFIFYIWLLGLDILFFEAHSINYQLILNL